MSLIPTTTPSLMAGYCIQGRYYSVEEYAVLSAEWQKAKAEAALLAEADSKAERRAKDRRRRSFQRQLASSHGCGEVTCPDCGFSFTPMLRRRGCWLCASCDS